MHWAVHHPDSPHAYRCPELDTSAIGRTHIHIHIANNAGELLGCIATGERVSSDGAAIEQSRAAFARLIAYLTGVASWTLVILDPQPETP